MAKSKPKIVKPKAIKPKAVEPKVDKVTCDKKGVENYLKQGYQVESQTIKDGVLVYTLVK